MEKMFGQMMNGFFGSMSEVDKQEMKTCCEKMAEICPCMDIKDVPEDAKEAMKERMKSFCGGKMAMMSACFHETNVQTDQAGSSNKA